LLFDALSLALELPFSNFQFGLPAIRFAL
jgi:hypothetical protein